MTLAFPNPSRSYDETRQAVRFTGHDGMFEVRFFVEVDALMKAAAQTLRTWPTEAACLSIFDTFRSTIYEVAKKVYSKHRNNIFTLTAADFN